MIKKLISLNPDVVAHLERVAKETKATQSSIVSTALTVYFMMFNYAPTQAKALNTMIPEGQIEWAEINKALKSVHK